MIEFLLNKKSEEINNSKTYSAEFSISYTDWFNWVDFSKNDETIFFSWREIKKSKIYEMINYVEKIKAIKETNQNYKIPWNIDKTNNFRVEVVKAGSIWDRKKLSKELSPPKTKAKKK